MTNREKGLQMLRWWYNASALDFKGITFDQAVYILTEVAEPRRIYLDIFGENYDNVGAYKAEDAMATLGELNQGKIPSPADFHEVLIDSVDPYKVSNFVPIVLDSVKSSAEDLTRSVADYGVFGIKAVYWIAIAAVGVYAFSTARRLS